MSLLSGHSDLFVTGIEDGLIGGLDSPDGAAYERALKATGIRKLYRILSYRSVYQNLKLMSRYNKVSVPFSRGQQKSFDFDFDTFEDAFLKGIATDEGKRSFDTFGEMMRVFYKSFAIAVDEAEKSFAVAKPCNGPLPFLRQIEQVKDINPLLLCLHRDPRAIIHSLLSREPNLNVEQHSRHLLEQANAAKALEAYLPVHHVRYEDICLDTHNSMKQIVDFLNIQMEPVLLTPQLLGQAFIQNSVVATH